MPEQYVPFKKPDKSLKWNVDNRHGAEPRSE